MKFALTLALALLAFLLTLFAAAAHTANGFGF